MDARSEVSLIAMNSSQIRKKQSQQRHRMSFLAQQLPFDSYNVGQVTPIDMLPDDVLLAIFDFYVDRSPDERSKRRIEAWQSLVHVCRLWRNLVFESPRRLNLRLLCTPRTRVRKTMDVWPALPLCIRSHGCLSTNDANDFLATFGHNDRIRQLSVGHLKYWQLRELWTAMEVPFPELTDLAIIAIDSDVCTPVVPDSFLGGSAPRLRHFSLECISFPGLPKLLLSATHLDTLHLRFIPDPGYFSPEAMATGLRGLTSLRSLVIQFKSPQYRPDPESRHLSPLARSLLPALTDFEFKGVAEYLEVVVAHIDAPYLNNTKISFFKESHFEIPQLVQLISRTPTMEGSEIAHFYFFASAFQVQLRSRRRGSGIFAVEIFYTLMPFRNYDRQVLALARVCGSYTPLLSAVEELYLDDPVLAPARWDDGIENTPWLELLRPFTAVKNLYLCEVFEPRIASALQELVGGRMMEVLPALQNLFLWDFQPLGPVHEGIEQFLAARQFTNHPVVVSRWDRDSYSSIIQS